MNTNFQNVYDNMVQFQIYCEDIISSEVLNLVVFGEQLHVYYIIQY